MAFSRHHVVRTTTLVKELIELATVAERAAVRAVAAMPELFDTIASPGSQSKGSMTYGVSEQLAEPLRRTPAAHEVARLRVMLCRLPNGEQHL